MSPPQPPLSPATELQCFCVAPVIHLDEVNLVCLSPLIAAAPLRFGCTAYFQTPSWLMWWDTIEQRRRVGLPKCHAFTADGGWEGFNSVESGCSIFAPNIQLLHPPHVPHKAAPAKKKIKNVVIRFKPNHPLIPLFKKKWSSLARNAIWSCEVNAMWSENSERFFSFLCRTWHFKWVDEQFFYSHFFFLIRE